MIAPLENLSETSFTIINLKLPREEPIQRVIDRYKGEFVLLLEDSGILDEWNFPSYQIGNRNYHSGVIKSPRDSGFRFETTAPNLKITRVFLDYRNIRELIVTEIYIGKTRTLRFVN